MTEPTAEDLSLDLADTLRACEERTRKGWTDLPLFADAPRPAAGAFKAWVHGWLDAAGVPADPDPGHTAQHGCRISGRLRHLLARAEAAERDLAEARRVCESLAARVAAQSELLSARAERADVRANQALFARE